MCPEIAAGKDGPVSRGDRGQPRLRPQPLEPPGPAGRPGARRSPRTPDSSRNRPSSPSRVSRAAALGRGPRPVVVPAKDLEHSREVLLTVDGVAYITPHPGPVRKSPALREDLFAHLWRDGEVGYVVAVDVPDLAFPVAERGGAEPAWLRRHAWPAQNLALDRQYVTVHGPPSPAQSSRSRALSPLGIPSEAARAISRATTSNKKASEKGAAPNV